MNIDDEELKTRGQLSNIDEKIAQVRNRKKKGNVTEKSSNEQPEDESYEMELEIDTRADQMKIKEKKKSKSSKKKKVSMKFFNIGEEKPNFSFNFRTMNSLKNRPLSIRIKLSPT